MHALFTYVASTAPCVCAVRGKGSTSKGVRPNLSMGLGSHCSCLTRYSTTE